MPFNRFVTVPTANTEGGAMPPRGTTGRYLFQENTAFRSDQISDNLCYPGQSFTVRETLTAYYEIYDPKLVTALDRYYIEKYYLGTWQTIERNSNQAVQREGKSRYLETVIETDHTFVMGYKRDSSYTDYGLFKIQQCNFSLEPSTPISIEILGVEVEFASYEIPSGRGNIFKGEYAIDRAYPVADLNFQLDLGKTGFYTFQGAALVELDYFVRAVNAIPGESYGYSKPFCSKS